VNAHIVRRACRRLLLDRFFLVVGVLTLAVGIGASASIFTLVRCVLWKRLPYPSPDQVVSLSFAAPRIGLAKLGHLPAFGDPEAS
jgi:hypothetical protein